MMSYRRSRVPLKTTIPRGTRQTLSHMMAIKSELYYIHVKKTDWFPGKPCLRQIGADLVQQSISGQIWLKTGQIWLKTGQNWLKTGQIWLKIGAELDWINFGANLVYVLEIRIVVKIWKPSSSICKLSRSGEWKLIENCDAPLRSKWLNCLDFHFNSSSYAPWLG